MTETVVQMVPLDLLLKAIETSVDAWHRDWETDEWFATDLDVLMDNKLQNVMAYRPRLISDLENGGQNNPIIVCVNGNADYGDTHGWTIGNGNHRLATAIALCLDEVMVAFTESREDFMLEEEFGF
jgi:hypothetical protein